MLDKSFLKIEFETLITVGTPQHLRNFAANEKSFPIRSVCPFNN